jgi:hypothetical protein
LGHVGKPLHDRIQSPLLRALHLPGVLAHLRLFERIRLSPEGITFDEMRRLTLALLRSGLRTFSLTYHSPSLQPGNTPYVRTESELDSFLAALDRYLDFFIGKLGGRPSTPLATRDLVVRAGSASARAPSPSTPLAAVR